MTRNEKTLGYTVETKKLDQLVPYWRNPRIITDEAVNAVAKSIADYGYQQPIIVDPDNVIVIGHTRYMALRRLGYTEAPVGVATNLSGRELKQLRTIDNRTSEYAEWDMNKLVDELGKLGKGFSESFFSELAKSSEPEPEFIREPVEATRVESGEESNMAEFVCPSCFHMWEMEITNKAVRSGLLKEKA